MFSENWPLNFGLQDVTYTTVYLVDHGHHLTGVTVGQEI